MLWQTHTKIKPVVKGSEGGINKKLTNMALLIITCRVKLIGAKWGFVTFRFLVWGVVFTENAAGSGGRQTDKHICDTHCWNKVLNMRHRQEYTTTINYNLSLLVGYFNISVASLYEETVKMEEITSAECNQLGNWIMEGGLVSSEEAQMVLEEVLQVSAPVWTSEEYVWLPLPIPAPTVKGHCSAHSESLWWAVLRKGTPLSLILCICAHEGGWLYIWFRLWSPDCGAQQ